MIKSQADVSGLNKKNRATVKGREICKSIFQPKQFNSVFSAHFYQHVRKTREGQRETVNKGRRRGEMMEREKKRAPRLKMGSS